MICTTTRKGHDCIFMKTQGCSYTGGTCLSTIENCMGCAHINEQESGIYCDIFPDPSAKWRLSNCNMATHLKSDAAEDKKKLNPMKASKRK